MEHRLGIRHPVAVVTILYPRASSPVTGLAREVSISGMFVEVPPQKLVMNSLLEVAISLPDDEAGKTFRWLAMVIRKTDTGAGLMFDRLRPPAIMRLIAAAECIPQLVYDARPWHPWPVRPATPARSTNPQQQAGHGRYPAS